jgi:uncharacterized protein (TIGR03435 family)
MKYIAIPTVVLLLAGSPLSAQTSAAEKLPEFDVASVKQNKSLTLRANSNFPLGPGDVYVPNGGFLSATNFPLITYLTFAYKVKGNQRQYLLQQLPKWVTEDRFDIQARAEGNPNKDQMRLMMRSLLADRFKLAIHTETREVPVLAFVLLKPGKTGPQLQLHRTDAPCSTEAPPPSARGAQPDPPTITGGLPALCGGIFGMPPSMPGRIRFAARNVTLAFVADSLSATANLGRPMLDQTGLTGTFDFSLEWSREVRGPAPPGVDFQPDTSGPGFADALREQLGIKLESQKGSVEVLVVDHIEHPSEN